MPTVVVILSILMGSYMLADGIHVMIMKRFIGPATPGPWRHVFLIFKIKLLKLGPLFCILGALWFAFLFAILIKAPWTQQLGTLVCILSLWYFPVGTAISLIVVLLLWFR